MLRAGEAVTEDDGRELDTVPHGLEIPKLPAEVVFAELVAKMLSEKLDPLVANSSLVAEEVKALRDEVRDRLRSHELELRELRKDVQDLDRRVMDLDERLTSHEAAE